MELQKLKDISFQVHEADGKYMFCVLNNTGLIKKQLMSSAIKNAEDFGSHYLTRKQSKLLNTLAQLNQQTLICKLSLPILKMSHALVD